MSQPVTVICTYRVKPGEEEAFVGLLERHWPTLRECGLVTDEPARVFRGQEQGGATTFNEIFAWKDERSPTTAHETPQIMAVWEPMGALCEARDGRPAMEFPHVQPVAMAFDEA